MELELSATHSLPTLQPVWMTWQKKGSADLPECNPSEQSWDESAQDQRLIYAYVSSDKLFTETQEDIRQALLQRGHPWMQRLLSVSFK